MSTRPGNDLMLGGAALALGALVAAVASSHLSLSELCGGLAASARVSAPRAALALASFLGIGYAVLRAFCPHAHEQLSKLECGFLAWIVGLLVASQCFWLLGTLGAFRPPVLLALQVLGLLLLAANAYRGLPGHSDRGPLRLEEQGPRLLLLTLIGAVAGAYLVRTLGTRVVHPDALQYHLGFPFWYLRLGEIVHFPSLVSSGRYLGADLLYGAVLNPEEPLATIAAKLLSWSLGATSFVGVFLLARRLGATRKWALVAVLALLTVPAVAHWGQAKNDLAMTGATLSALWLLAVALEQREPRWSLWIGLCLGYAASVKVPILVIAPIVGLALWRWLGLRSALVFALGCIAPIVPWALTAYAFQGTPVYHFFADRPAYMAELWLARSSNGLTLSVESFFRNAIPLLLDSDGRIPGNDSLGLPFLVAAALAVPACLRRGPAAAACLAAGAYLVAGMLFAFETRLLNRYFLLAPAVAFAVATAWMSSLEMPRQLRRGLPVAVAVALMATGLGADSIFRGLGGRAISASIQAGGGTPRDPLASRLARVGQAESLLDEGEVLLINDGMVYGLKAPFVNAHALHSAVFRYDLLDAEGLARALQDMRVGAALIRTDVSGVQPQLLEVLDRFATRTAGRRRLQTYRFDWKPEGPAAREVQGDASAR